MVLTLADFKNSYGQSSNTQTVSGFKLYENSDYNIQIQYPKNWEKSEQDLPAHTIVQFVAPENKGCHPACGSAYV